MESKKSLTDPSINVKINYCAVKFDSASIEFSEDNRTVTLPLTNGQAYEMRLNDKGRAVPSRKFNR